MTIFQKTIALALVFGLATSPALAIDLSTGCEARGTILLFTSQALATKPDLSIRPTGHILSASLMRSLHSIPREDLPLSDFEAAAHDRSGQVGPELENAGELLSYFISRTISYLGYQTTKAMIAKVTRTKVKKVNQLLNQLIEMGFVEVYSQATPQSPKTPYGLSHGAKEILLLGPDNQRDQEYQIPLRCFSLLVLGKSERGTRTLSLAELQAELGVPYKVCRVTVEKLVQRELLVRFPGDIHARPKALPPRYEIAPEVRAELKAPRSDDQASLPMHKEDPRRALEREILRAQDSVTLAVALLNHQGPLDITNQMATVSMAVQEAWTTDPRQMAIAQEWVKLGERFLSEIQTPTIRLAVRRVHNPRSISLKNITDLSTRYMAWLDESEALFKESIKFLQTIDSNGMDDHVSPGLLMAQRALLNVQAVQDYFTGKRWQEEISLNGLAEGIPKGSEWLTKTSQRFRIDVVLQEGASHVLAYPPAFHQVFERTLENCFAAIQDMENKLPENLRGRFISQFGIVRIRVEPCVLANGQAGVRFRIRNPGHIQEGHNEQLFIVDYAARLKNFSTGGIGLHYTQRAVVSMGGSIRLENVPQAGLPMVETVIELPAPSAQGHIHHQPGLLGVDTAA